MNLLPWLSLSSDLNPTENERGELKRRSTNVAVNLKDLERFCMEEWSLISYQVFSKLFRHYRRKLRAVTLSFYFNDRLEFCDFFLMKDKKNKQCRFIFTATFAHIYQYYIYICTYFSNHVKVKVSKNRANYLTERCMFK